MVWVTDKNYFNVAVERHNLRPVHSSLIMERVKEFKKYELLRSNGLAESGKESNPE
jgi:hypothetical protein